MHARAHVHTHVCVFVCLCVCVNLILLFQGMLHARLPLDREKASLYLENGTAVYTVTVVATDNGSTPLSASAVVCSSTDVILSNYTG